MAGLLWLTPARAWPHTLPISSLTLVRLTSGSHFTQVKFGSGAQVQTAVLDIESAAITFGSGTTNAPAQPASLIPDRTNAPSPVPLQEPTAAAPPNEAMRLALPVMVVLLLCVFGWYARSQQRKASRTLPPAMPDEETPSQPSRCNPTSTPRHCRRGRICATVPQRVDMDDDRLNAPPTYAWPKFVLAGVVLFVVLAGWWLLQEVARIRRAKAGNVIHHTNPVSPAPLPPKTNSFLSVPFDIASRWERS